MRRAFMALYYHWRYPYLVLVDRPWGFETRRATYREVWQFIREPTPNT